MSPSSVPKDKQHQQQQEHQQQLQNGSPASPSKQSSVTTDRPLIIGPDVPEQPYPVFLEGLVCKGFGRGSKELGIPTANLPEQVAQEAGKLLETGIYYGVAQVDLPREADDKDQLNGESDCQNHLPVYGMVMSFGWNPYYKNEKRTAEVHILHSFPQDFYDRNLKVIVAGYIRPEKDYSCLDDLIKDIHIDIMAAKKSMEREAYKKLIQHEFFSKKSSN
jgi:riboflavin kinase